MQIPFLGGSYLDRSIVLNSQMSINCFPVIDNKEAKNVLSMTGTPGLLFFAQATVYGSGADGTVTISTNTSLTRDMQYNTLTVNAGITLNTAGFTVCVLGTLTNNGTITDSTSGGIGGTGGTGYTDAGLPGGAGTYAGSGAGGDGGSGRGSTGVGGTGGKGGGQVRIFARTLTNNGTIHANAENATAPSGEAGDGADGGNGGTVSLFYENRTIGTVTVAAGSHSNGVAYGIDSYTKLMIHPSDADGTAGTDITDSEITPKTITAVGNAQVDSSTLLCAGVTDYFTLADHVDWYMATNEFTIEFRVSTIEEMNGFFSIRDDANNYVYCYSANGYIYFKIKYLGTEIVSLVSAYGWNVIPGEKHIAIHRGWGGDANAWAITVDGTQSGSTVVDTDAWPDLSTEFIIAKVSATGFNGRIRYFRVSKGIDRWTANFTPPSAPYSAAVDGSDGSAGTATWTSVPYFTFSSAVFRGGIVVGSKLYICVGSGILSISTTGVASYLGAITTSTGNVFMAFNGTQVLIVDGTAYGHYVTTATDVLSDISDGDFPAATSCCFIDGYFVITKASSGQIYVSGLYDVTTWDPADVATAEGAPDNLVRCMQANNNLWLFGAETTEVWYDSASSGFPFTRINGALIEDGIIGSGAICLIKDQFYFLSNKLEVLRTVGYQREKISTIHLDKEIQAYTTTSDALAYEYRVDGHIFFVLTFPTRGKTWVYDVTTEYWHEWQSYTTQGVAEYGRHRGNLGFYFANKYIVGDHTNGYLYELSMTTYTDNGEIIKRTRRTQTISKERKNLIYHSLTLDFKVGVGIGGTGTGSDPQVSLRWSDDNTRSWSSWYSKALGQEGEDTTRVIWRRLGKARDRIYEVTMSEPVKFALFGAYAEIEECNS